MTFCHGQLLDSRHITLSRALVMVLLSQAGEGFSSTWCSKSQTRSRLHIPHGDARIKEVWFHVVWLEEDSWEETASFSVNTPSGYAAAKGIAT